MKLNRKISQQLGIRLASLFVLFQISQASNSTDILRLSSLNRKNVTSTATNINLSSVKISNPNKSVNTSRVGSIYTRLVVGGANKTQFGEQTESSLLRPLLLRGLISAREKLTGKVVKAESDPQEEEVVEQTIVVPIGSQQEVGATKFGASNEEEGEEYGKSSVKELSEMKRPAVANHKKASHDVAQSTKLSSTQDNMQPEGPQAEASIRLTRHEIDGLLTDKEAPEFYREREHVGDGVSVKEEQPLNTASSDNSMGHMGPGYGYANGGVSDSYTNQNRLLHSASEEYGNPNFYHRFGHSGEAAGGYYGPAKDTSGRLMQSPAHVSEHSEFNQVGHGYAGQGLDAASAYGPGSGDYGPHSGLLRAGSGDFSQPMSGYEGAAEGYGAAGFSHGGYPGSPVLDRHASELYGPTGDEFGSYNPGAGMASDLYGHGRLESAGSHRPDEYSSRFGSMPYEHQAFANRDRLMLQGNSMLSGSVRQPGKLAPLSPVIPVDEVSSASAMRESSSYADQSRHPARAQRHEQVHEPLEDDPASTGEPNESTYSGSSGRPTLDESQQQSDGYDGDQERARQQYSHGYGQTRAEGSEDRGLPSLVLNVPPPSAESRPTVEFSRAGSAGYLPPHLRGQEQEAEPRYGGQKSELVKKMSRQREEESSYDPASNPAHAGKYIID